MLRLVFDQPRSIFRQALRFAPPLLRPEEFPWTKTPSSWAFRFFSGVTVSIGEKRNPCGSSLPIMNATRKAETVAGACESRLLMRAGAALSLGRYGGVTIFTVN